MFNLGVHYHHRLGISKDLVQAHKLYNLGGKAGYEEGERKGPCAKQDLFDIVTEFSKRNPPAKMGRNVANTSVCKRNGPRY